MEQLPQNAWEWVVSTGCVVGPWLGLWALGDHRHFKPAVSGGLLFALIATVADDYGVSTGLWEYPESMVPLLTSNWLWNVVGAAPKAILVCEVDMSAPQHLWWWMLGLAAADSSVELLILKTTDLLSYPHWSPLISFPVYIVILWVVIWFTRWQRAVPPWNPPAA